MDKPLDSVLDLTRGDRDYLSRKGISMQQFDKMDPVSQNEWKDECNECYYEGNDQQIKERFL